MKKKLHENICEEKVFEVIYNKYATDLHNFLYYKFGEDFDPSDKVQDAFVKLWNNCSKVSISKAKAFLFTVANNLMLNSIKHHKVVLKYKLIPVSNYSNESPEFIMEQNQFNEEYKKALSKLTEEQRVAFLLNKAEGKKHKEIAEFLGVTQKVVEYRIYSAFNILKEELENFYLK